MSEMAGTSAVNFRDARVWQIASLALLLTLGMARLGFDQTPGAAALVVGTALATQYVCGRLVGLARFDPLSPLITGLSLSILLRASEPGWLALAACIAVASKFALRIDGKHVFNPANIGIAVMLLATDVAWISPAQWGSTTWGVMLFASLATLVLSRARRGDIAIAFLVAYLAILFARAAWLGDPWAIPLKQMQSGALLLFAFFMISDPKTTPDRRDMRILFACIVAALAAYLQLVLFRPEGLILALFFLSPLVPLIDRLAWRERKAPRFQWSNPLVN